jgi:hypothetical protein
VLIDILKACSSRSLLLAIGSGHLHVY